MAILLPDQGFGLIPDPPDARDFPAKALIVAAQPLPSTYRVDPNTIIYDQDGKPKCACSSTCGVNTALKYIHRGKRYQFDDDWHYIECKKRDGIPNQPGTYLRVACKVLADVGVPVVTKKCPLSFLKPNQPQPSNDPSLYRIKAYYRVGTEDTIELIKQIIFQYGSLACGSMWYNNWMDKFSLFPAPDKELALHAYKTDGWDPVGFVIVNSYGKILWGDNGVATMPYQIFLDYVLPNGDIWKLVDA